MSNFEVMRSVRFVSLDTHPANNSLVVTYEILVTVHDTHSKQELLRRTKRDQLQIDISELDNMGASDLKKAAKTNTLNLGELGQTIVKKCPLLEQRDRSQTLEEIQLHLLYLFNRKRSQIYQTAKNPDRPPSAASGRLRSATPTGSASSARQGSARDGRRSSMSTRGENSNPLDCYAILCENELKASRGCTKSGESVQNLDDEFVQHFFQHLSSYNAMQKTEKNFGGKSVGLNAQLEGLYGELDEKIAAVRSISELVQDDQKLVALEPDRLLVIAMIRTLLDSEATDARLSESILYCLVRFTQFMDVYERIFNQDEPVDIVRVVVDLIEMQSRLASKADQLRPILERFYHLNAVLTIINNLLALDEMKEGQSLRKKLIQLHGKRLAASLTGLFVLISRYLARDLRNQSTTRYERLTLILANLIRITQTLSIYREFVNLLRAQSQTMAESLISCINTLQLSRPGSGSVQQTTDSSKKQAKQSPSFEERFFVRDQLILCEIYQLEIDLLKLVNNFIYDTRFKLRFSRKNLLLKCVLRNLVVFLASSRRSNTLEPFHRSSVLLVPFKCLYELSCQQSTIEELFKSKIVLKCLLEFLLSSTSDLKTVLDSLSIDGNKGTSREGKNMLDDDQITLIPHHATHYITNIWINLSAKKTAPFFAMEVDRELSEPMADYIGLANQNLETFIKKTPSKRASKGNSPIFEDAQMDIYLHAKLLRNLTQFIMFHQCEPMIWVKQYARWVEQESSSLDQLLSLIGRTTTSTDTMLLPLSVELIGTLTNLIANADSLWKLDNEVSCIPMLDWPHELASILNQLLEINLFGASTSIEGGENDDFLLVSMNLIGRLARNREICNELQKFTGKLTALCNFILEAKSTDVEMIVSCLFTLFHLLNHWSFLKSLGSQLEDQQAEVVTLINRLSPLVMHGDSAISKLANAILNTLKQFEEQQSLSDSVACRHRFVCYNEKWLNAIRANRDEPAGSQADTETALLMENGAQAGRELDTNDEFSQLRTVAMNEESVSSSSRISTSSSNRSSMLPEEATATLGRSRLVNRNREDNDDDDDLNDDDDDLNVGEQEDEDEDTFSEPDLNVIDANSMIKHLTNRREFRAELMTMRRA